jgi:hypothetical protein
MKLWIRLSLAVVSTITCAGLTFSLRSQDKESKPNTNPKHPSGAFEPEKSKAVAGTLDFTLQRVRDFHYSGGNVGCPKCKDMFTARIAPPVPGAVITSVTVIARRPPNNNHWYRCQVEVSCGRAEFSDPNDARLDCLGKTACDVNRATDDGVGGYEDDIRMTYK